LQTVCDPVRKKVLEQVELSQEAGGVAIHRQIREPGKNSKDAKTARLKERLAEMKQYENALYSKGVRFIAGVDEVGRGPLAGPVCAAAVVLPEDFDLLGVDDSKKITEKRREILYGQILEKALAWGIGFADNQRIDAVNILNATKEAMLSALWEASLKLEETCGKGVVIDHILVDAVELAGAGAPVTAIIKGDALSVSIAAASIIAKVTRDRMMVGLDSVYPGYGFVSNKGYGTKAHYEGIARLGLTPIHRRSFIK
jgi:ribonuclease HII